MNYNELNLKKKFKSDLSGVSSCVLPRQYLKNYNDLNYAKYIKVNKKKV